MCDDAPVTDVHAAADATPPGPVRDDNWVSRKVDGETVLIPIRAGAADLQFLFVLNATASWVWQQLDGSRTLDEIAHGLTEQFDVTLERAQIDVRQLVETFIEARLARPLAGSMVNR